jgi:hypothetical protein
MRSCEEKGTAESEKGQQSALTNRMKERDRVRRA